MIKEFREQKEGLISAKHQLDKDVDDAKAQNREIKEDVQQWPGKEEQVLEAVACLEDNIKDNKGSLASRLNWKGNIFYLLQKSHFDRVFRVDTLWDNEFFSSRGFFPSQSLKSALDEIANAMKDERESVIAVLGPRGMGKTTLADLVAKKAEELLHFNVVRLVVSPSTSTENVQDALAAFLRLQFDKKTEEERAEQLRLRLKTEKRILIILDDFRKELDLESIGIPCHAGCKIFVTTSDRQVCSSISNSKVIRLGALNVEEALNLLQKNLGLDMTWFEINQVAKQVAYECKHSPIALIIIGRALRGQVLTKWKEAYQSLKSKLAEGETKKVRIVYRSVKLSYDHLKNDETKICFLLCSLFPKEHPIALQDLIRFTWGLGIYQGIDSVEKVREKVYVAIYNLMESFLLSQHGNAHVQMQNSVRDAALWLASKDESFLRIKSVVGLWERSKNEDLESYTAISYVSSKLEELHDEEFRSEKLQIMFIGGDSCKTISSEFFQWLEALKVLAIHHGLLSLNALQNLTNLRALHFDYCKLNDLSSIGKLKKLEILSFQGSGISELPDELGELDNLRLLDLFDCQNLHRIPLNLIGRLSRLEDLYFSGLSFETWWSREKTAEGSNTTPSNIISPPSLATESYIKKKKKKGKSGAKLPAMRGSGKGSSHFGPTSTSLKVSVFLQNQSKEWDRTTKYLDRDHIRCYQNDIVPSLVQSVKEVIVKSCAKLQDIFQDGSILHAVKEEGSVLSDLTSLELEDLPQLRRIWYGQTDRVNLQNLNTVKLKDCHNLQSLFSMSLAQSLKQLETLEIHGCNKLKKIIAETRDDLHPGVLDPRCLPSLTTLRITGCRALEYIFQIERGQILPKLTLLDISSCPDLEQVFSFKDVVGRNDSEVPQLKRLALKNLMSLRTFCSDQNSSIKLPSLQYLKVGECHQLSNAAMFQVMRHGKLKGFCLFKLGNQMCEEMFEFRDEYFLSNLEELKLKYLNELQVIWKQPTQIVALQNLTCLKVVGCNKLSNIFSLLLARNLLQLTHLIVKGCEELVQIVVRDQISSSSSTSRLKPVYFPNLMTILIEDCNKLKSVFPVSVVRLPELRKLRVRRASKLEQIFSYEGEARVKSEKETESEAKVKSEKEIVKLRFPKLKKLRLEKLPSLVTFNPVDYCCEFPDLESLKVTECNLLVTRFGMTESDPTVYAKTKEPSLRNEENYHKLRSSVTFQEIPTRNGDIDWSRGMKID